MECSICQGTDYVIRTRLNLFGNMDHSFLLCIWHRMELSNIIVEDNMEDNMENYNVPEVPTVQYAVEYFDNAPLPGLPFAIIKHHSDGTVQRVELDQAMQERLEYYNMEMGLDLMDSIDRVMEYHMEYSGRMSARCYYCWLESEHSIAYHKESETEYSKYGSWPSHADDME